MPALGRHPAVRPQYGPSAHPRQTSRSMEPLWSFGKPQENRPMDVTQRIQSKSKISKDFLRRSIKALHWVIRCRVVSSSSWQRGRPESCRIHIRQRCRLRSVWPVRSPTFYSNWKLAHQLLLPKGSFTPIFGFSVLYSFQVRSRYRTDRQTDSQATFVTWPVRTIT